MARPVLGVLDRYLLRELAGPFLLGTVLFTVFLLIDRLYHLTELVITRGVPLHLVLQLLALMLPSFLAHTLPMALLMAVLVGGGRLAADLEIVACRAAGVSPWRLFRPVAAAALAIVGATAALTLVVNPAANRAFQHQLVRIVEARAAAALRDRVFTTAFSGVVVYVEELGATPTALRGVLVSDERDPKISRIITARAGHLLTDETSGRITLRLLDGGVNEADVEPVDPPRHLRTDQVPAGGAASARRYRYTAFSVYDMALAVDSPLRAAPRIQKPEKDLTWPELRAAVREAGEPGTRLPLLVELHKRLAVPAAALVFALAGFPLAVRAQRGGRSAALVTTLAILVAYHVLLSSLEGLAQTRVLPAWLAVWAPNLLFGALGTLLLTAAARGWRAPRLGGLWRVLAAAGRRVPRPRVRAVRRALWPGTTLLLDRYLLRRYIGLVAAGLGVAAALVVTVELLDRLDRYLRARPPLAVIAEHFLYSLPVDLHQGLPVVMLVATIFLFLALARWHELTALKAAGISLYRASAPVLLFAGAVAAGAGLVQEFVLPVLRERGEEVDRVKIRGQLPRHLQSRTRLWLRSGERRFYRVELLSPAAGELYGLTILDLDTDFRLRSRVDARRARWGPGGWELRDGAVRELGPDGQVTTRPFARTALPLGETLEDFTAIQKPPAAMSYRELREYVARLEAAGFRVQRYLVDLYAKLSEPLRSLILVLVAIPLAVHGRGGRLYGAALAIAVMAAYLVTDYSARAFARAELLPPALGAWTANVIFLGVGAALFLRART